MDTISLIAMVRLISHDVLHTLICPRRVGHNRVSPSNVYQSLTRVLEKKDPLTEPSNDDTNVCSCCLLSPAIHSQFNQFRPA